MTLWMVMGFGAIVAYFIPRWASQVINQDRPVSWQARAFTVLVFLLLSWLSWRQHVESFEFILSGILLLILLWIAMTDHWYGIIPNKVTYPTILLLMGVRLFIQPQLHSHYLLAMLIGGICVWILAILTQGMGIGDAKLVAIGGLLVGWPDIFLAFWLATVSGTILILFRWLIGKPIERKTPFPFGPHLTIGIVFTYLYGENLFSFLMSSLVLSPLATHMLVLSVC